ncbi:MAG: DUF6489 family protein [Pseudomonadales bacterium]|jgi:hypothetical protein|nr:DUF6489 family protein [Pseudomonadales bacterium]MDG1441149.1 DUF6489 family protein [Pseudomonadales bacterium]
MKVTIDVDITPEELRRFIGLPDVENLQKEMLSQAHKYLQDSNQTQYKDLLDSAVQPMMAYQSWLQKMMMPGTKGNDKKDED